MASERYADFWQVTQDALVFAANKQKLELTPEKREQLINAYLQLRPWPEVPSALKALKQSGLRLGFLSNLTPRMLDGNIRSASLDGLFEQVLSTDIAKTYKPRARAYESGQDEQSRAAIFSRSRIAHHGSFVSVIDLPFFARRREDHGAGLGRLVSAQLADKALNREIAGVEAVIGHQILPDGHRVPATTQAEFDRLPERLADRNRARVIFRANTPQPYAKPGDHLVGRFCGLAFALSFLRKGFGVGVALRVRRLFCRPGDHFIGRFCRRPPSPSPRWSPSNTGCL